MRRIGPLLLIFTVLLLSQAFAFERGDQRPAALDMPDLAADGAIRFTTMDVVIDSGSRPLAAWQFELHAEPAAAGVKIVGIEGGEHPAFRKPAYYDPAAMMNDRLIAGSFSLLPPDQLPTGATRVATIHLQLPVNLDVELPLTLVVAADAEGKAIKATITRGTQR